MPAPRTPPPRLRTAALLTVGVISVAGVAQVLAEDVLRMSSAVAPLVLAPVALALLWLAIRRPRFLASTQVSTCLIAALALGCILGTLIVQRTDTDNPVQPDPEKSFRTFALAEATFLVKTGDFLGGNDVPAPSDDQRALVAAAGRHFGDRVARETEASIRRQLDDADDKARSERLATEREDAFRGFHALVKRARIDVVFLSWSFNALLATLALGIVVLLVRRWPYRGRAPFALMHLGILVILAGALVSSLTIDRGFLRLGEGQSSPGYYSMTQGRAVRFADGLRVGVRDVDKSWWHTLHVVFPGDDVQSTFLVREGRRYEIDDGKLVVEMGRYRPDALVQMEAHERSDGAIRPAVRVEIRAAGRAIEGWLVSGGGSDEDTWALGEDGPVVSYRRVGSADEARRWLDVRDGPALGRLRLAIGSGETNAVEVSRDLETSVGPVRVVVLEVARDAGAARAGVPFERQAFRDPGLHVEVLRDGRAERRWLSRGETDLGDEVRASFDWPRLDPREIRFVEGGGTSLTLLTADGKGRILRRSVGDGPIAIDGRPELLVRERLERFGTRPRVLEELGSDEEPGPMARRVGILDVTIRSPDGAREGRLISGPRPDSPVFETMSVTGGFGDTAVLALRATSEREYRTTLELLEEDGTRLRGLLRVNHPIRHAGYRLYQTDMEEGESPTWSTMQVVRDPGIPIVYLGLGATFLGVVWMLLVEPARRARRRRRQIEAEAAAAAGVDPVRETPVEVCVPVEVCAPVEVRPDVR